MDNKYFTHLHLHDQYSTLDGLGTAEKYCERAKEIGFQSLAVTNHGNVDGCIQFQKACDASGIRPIFGCEAYIVPDLSVKKKGEKKAHISLLAQNITGWQNILKMLTVANLDGFYTRPRIDSDLLIDHCEGVAVGSACVSSYLRWPKGQGVILANRLSKRGVTVYLELMPIDMDIQREFNVNLCNLSEKYGWPLVATNDCHYVLREHSRNHEVLLAMQTKKKWSDPTRWRFDVDTLYLQTVEEMETNFKIYGGIDEKYWREAMENTSMIADTCDVRLEKKEVILPNVYIEKYSDMSPEDQLMRLMLDGWMERKKKHPWITPDKEEQYINRMMEEYGIICGLGFANYFLIVWELIHWCRKNGIMTGPGRGSVGGSLVAFCLEITEVDPLKYDLVFSRFISEARIDLPDIDMDFEDRKREDVIQHLRDLYGEYNVIGVSNFMKMHGKSALRSVSRVFDVPNAEVNRACKAIITRSGGDMRADFSLIDSFETIEDGKRFYQMYRDVADIAIDMEGLIMGHSRHAAAAVVSGEDLRLGTRCNYADRKGKFACNWEKNDSEYNGLMKLDILGLNALTILNETRQLLLDRRKVKINYDVLPLDDVETLAEFNKGNCVGVFQFNGNSIMRFCRDIGIEEFEDVVALNALHRPGTLKSGTIHNYKDRKHGIEKVFYPHPMIEDITKDTQGIMLYQEQIMRIMYECAGLGWKTADTIRKAVSKSQGEAQLMKFRESFIEGCKRMQTLSQEDAENIFETIKTFGGYGFNKAHAVEYSLIAYWEMYLKIHHTTEYFMAYLSCGNDSKKDDMIQEARRLGLKIIVPDINLSESETWQGDMDGNLLIPFQEIKGVGPVASDEIVEKRNEGGPFKSFQDFLNRVDKRKVNSRVQSLLRDCYCFDEDKAICNLDDDEEKLEALSQFFNFSLSNDPMYKYRAAINRVRNYIPIRKITDVTGRGDLVWGYIDKITYQIKTASADSIGYSGCYGQLKDEDSNYIMINFTKELYAERKDDLEHSEGRWMIGQVIGRRDDALTISRIWYGEDLLTGNISLPMLRMIENTNVTNTILNSPYINIKGDKLATSLFDCAACELRSECRQPIYPDHGRYNAMMIGEAPGRNEDANGLGFVGDAGDIIWFGDAARDCVGLSSYGLSRDDFWVSNFVKCWPRITRTPKQKHINICRHWWMKEVQKVNPFVILAFGNTGLNAIKGQKSGIMDASGTVEWIDELNCWVVYCLHPAAVLYQSENNVYYNKGIMSFLNVFLNVGFGV